MRVLLLLAAGAGMAAAQCYSFSAPGLTYMMNVMGVQSGTVNGTEADLIVTQQSTLITGGKTYVSAVGPGNIFYFTESGATSFSTAVLGSPPPWQVDISLIGMVTLSTQSLPASLPSVSAWQIQPPQLEYSISGVVPAATKLVITSIGSCSGGGGGNPTGVPGPTLGDPSSEAWCPICPHPIHLGTGNMFESAVDYQTYESNRLSFIRYYNSLTAAPSLASSLGINWRSNYDRYLQISGSSVIAERPDGQQVTFTASGPNWSTDSDLDFTLVNSGSAWTLTDHNDTVETYNTAGGPNGFLQSLRTRSGYLQTLAYNAANQLASVTDSFNQRLSFTYSANGLLQSVTTPDGLVLTYAFKAAGSSNVLSSVSYSTTPATTTAYLYENASLPGALTAIIDENGARYLGWTYDSKGRAVTQLTNNQPQNTIVYNDSDGSCSVTNALGEQLLYKFATMQGVPKVVEADRIAAAGIPAATRTFTYDANGYPAGQTDWNGNKTVFVNDSRGQLLSMTEAAGTPQARTVSFSYHPTFHLPVHIVTPALSTDFTYDSAGELLTRTFTDTTSSTAPYVTKGQTRTWTYTWSNSELMSVQGPRTDSAQLTQFAYAPDGALISITNSLKQTTRITRHLPGGLPQTIVDPNGVTANLVYDARLRLLSASVTTAAGVLTTTNTYDAAGNLAATSLPDGSGLANTYDAAHRLTGIADKVGNSIAITLDALGDRTQVAFSGSGGIQLKRTAAFDALGRILKSVGGAGQAWSFVYDNQGNTPSVSGPLNRNLQQSFDALNRRVKIIDPMNGAASVSYDSYGRPISVTDPSGASTTYSYNGFGDLIQQVSPATGTTIYRVDAAGNPVQKTDARGVVANLSYDALDRLVAVTYPANPAENITFVYDEDNHGFGAGRLTSVHDASGTLSRSYDERGNVLSESRTYLNTNTTLVTRYAYDSASRLVALTYPSGWMVSYARDAMGRITGVSAIPSGAAASRPILSSVAYQPFGPVSALTFGNGLAEKRAFDQDYRLTSIASSGVQNLAYNYDAANNVLAITDGLNASNSQTLTYDALDRLVGAAGAYGKLAYSYDSNGRRISETSPATADGLGQAAAFTYNQAGRLSSVLSGSRQLTSYTYDAFGRRIMKIGSITATLFYQYDLVGRLLEETDGQGKQQVDYVYLGGRPIAAIQGDGSIYFIHADRLGTPMAATAANQSVLWSSTYQPFGQIAQAPSNIALDLRLPGHEQDLETGLEHNGFRDYVAAWGSYSTSDPIGVMGGTNTYAYAAGNPLRFIDPLGLECELAGLTYEKFSNDVNNWADATTDSLFWNGAADALSGFNTGVDAVDWAGSSLYSALTNGFVDTLDDIAWAGDYVDYLAASSLENLATTYAEGSDEFANMGFCLLAETIPEPIDWILTGGDATLGTLFESVPVQAGGKGASIATVSQGLGMSAIGVFASTAKAPTGQKGVAFSASTMSAVAGGATEVLAAGRIGSALEKAPGFVRAPAIGVGGAFAGYFVAGAVKCGLAFAEPQFAGAILQ